MLILIISMSNLSHGGEVAWMCCKTQLVVMKDGEDQET
jgi:hypothetical protein